MPLQTFNGKLMILSAIISQNGVFRPRDIVHETGMSSALVAHHLKQLLKTGMIESSNAKYIVTDKEGLIQLLVTGAEPNNKRAMYKTPFFSKERADTLNSFIQRVRIARALDFTGSTEIKKATIEALDDLIESAKSARKGLTDSNMMESTAINLLFKDYDTYLDYLQKVCFEALEIKVNKSKLKTEIDEAISRKED